MNTKIFSTLALGAALTGLCACDNWVAPTGTDGELDMKALSVDVSEIEKVITINAGTDVRSRAAEYNVNDFTVKISDGGGAVAGQWTYETTPEVATLKPGAYKLEVYSHEVQPAEWEKPYFYASKDFTIISGAIERIGTLTAKLANSAVSIRFDEKLMRYLGEDVTVEVKANDGGTLVYTPTETRKGYFRIIDGSTTMVVTFSGTVNGYSENFTKTLTDLEAGQHRIITFKAGTNPNQTPDETGTIDPSTGIVIDASVTDEDVDGSITFEEEILDAGDREGKEDNPEEPNPPTPPGDTDIEFDLCDDLLPEGVYNYNEFGDGSELAPGTKQAKMTINCPGKIAGLTVDIKSPYLTDEFLGGVGLSTHFDLTDPKEFESALKGFGFPVKNEVAGKTTVDFNITTLVPLLSLSGDDTLEHTFVITVTDESGTKSEKSLTFTGHD